MKIVVPAYFGLEHKWTDSDGRPHDCWRSIEEARNKVSIVIPDESFPTLAPSSLKSAQKQFRRCRGVGQKVLGYVHTREKSGDDKPARRAATDILKEIDDWYEAYDGCLDGIFFDEAVYWYDQESATKPNDNSAETFFGGLIKQLKEKHQGATSVLIAGQTVSEWTVQHSDYVVMWEEKYDVYLNKYCAINKEDAPVSIPSWWKNSKYRDQIVHLVWNTCSVDDMNNAIDCARNRNAGNVFVLDERKSGYDHLPPYWEQELNH
ncbi:spherulation-specific family 4 protein [Cystobacter ferrugineus]|uniref:Glycoside-hydrolase family GH114 TIM-barrel domain-containing protein n=2 Tax=Cystobacter TaxID=42 RepID=A0A1L9BEH4_9BACT|nr:spherulation-specific family 4 protein [Cystobacter ferrugineus]AYM53560.1 hypothetical protein [Cystobacter ferrugineus]AYM53605.1 hypothetical protein [Cystobacter velatus]OJH40654.1 hypothetical protein BON30_06815 [Cystobacter ferrugineus]